MLALRFEIDPQGVPRLQGYRRPSEIPTPEVLDILRGGIARRRDTGSPLTLGKGVLTIIDSKESHCSKGDPI